MLLCVSQCFQFVFIDSVFLVTLVRVCTCYHYGYELVGGVRTTFDPVSHTICHALCLVRYTCLSYTYVRVPNLCYLSTVDMDHGGIVQATSGMVYSEKREWAQQIVRSECSTCSNTCTLDTSTQSGINCLVTECTAPPELHTGSHILGNMNAVGSTIKYVCSYYPSVSNTSTCSSNGQWSVVQLDCSPRITSTTTPALTDPPPFTCPPDDSVFRSVLLNDGMTVTYRVFQSADVTYSSAVQTCASHGGHLIRVLTRARQDMLHELLRDCAVHSGSGKDYYIDGTSDMEGTSYVDIWRTSDGTSIPMGNYFWCSDAPDNHDGQRCLRLKKYGGYCQDNTKCTSLLAYICEK